MVAHRSRTPDFDSALEAMEGVTQPGDESAAAAPDASPDRMPPATGGPAPSRTSGWLALLVGFTVVAATLGLWRALIAQERAEMERTVAFNLESVRTEINAHMDSRILALVRMARRWEMRGQPPRAEWESDAKLYLSHSAGFLAIVRLDPGSSMNWQVPQQASRGLYGADFAGGRQRDALQQARLQRGVTMTSPFGLTTGDQAFLVNVPLFHGEVFDGFIVGVFDVKATFEAMLRPSIAPHYSIAVYGGGEEIYRRAAEDGQSAQDWGREATVELHGAIWRVRVWPDERLVPQRSPLGQAVLFGGLTLALLLALTVRFAQLARQRARETGSINRQLERMVAEHRQTNEWLRKLTRAVEQSPSMVLITDRHGAIEYVNPKFTQVTGYTLEEIAEENPRLLKSGEADAEVYQRLWRTITAGREWRGVLHDRKKNGELFWVHSAISPIRDARGATTHFLAEMEDITERKRLEQQVEERNREIARSQALAAMGQAASMIAHDLRNPLSTINMTLQMLRKKPPQNWTEAERELLQISQEQERYMEEVLSDLLSYSMPDALMPEWLGVDKLLDTAVMLSQRQIQERRMRVKTHYQPGLPVLYGDASKLRQAFVNLIANAAQATATPNQTPSILIIDVRLRPAVAGEFSIQIEICDNGPGVVPEYLDRVFEPFFTTRAQGTGLGLSIAKRIIEQHQGSISLRSEHPLGTRVTVVLPIQPMNNRQGS